MASFRKSAPWNIFHREVSELFRYDEEVHVVYDEAEYHIKLYVDNGRKAAALAALIPAKKIFGNITVLLSVFPTKDHCPMELSPPDADVFTEAFYRNGAFSFAKTVSGIFSNNLTYVVFRKCVVQYFNDDLGDVYGQCTTLYQEIAKHVFGETEGVFFCTDCEDTRPCDSVGGPLGEWP